MLAEPDVRVADLVVLTGPADPLVELQRVWAEPDHIAVLVDELRLPRPTQQRRTLLIGQYCRPALALTGFARYRKGEPMRLPLAVPLAALLSAALLAVAAPASAHDASWEHDHANDANPGGSHPKYCVSDAGLGLGACFQPYGEWWFIVDDASDGYSPVVEWHVDHADNTPNDRKGDIWHLKGAFNEAYKNKSYPEDRGIHFRICRGLHGTHTVTTSCSDWGNTLT